MKLPFLATVAVGMAVMTLSSCSQVMPPPSNFHADFGRTGDLPIATSDCKVICARAEGSSQGLTLLGFIPVKVASETAAIKGMYDNARARGAKIEGESRFFVNKGIESEYKNYILFSTNTLRASGDLVQYMTNKPVEHAATSVSAPNNAGEKKGFLSSILPL